MSSRWFFIVPNLPCQLFSTLMTKRPNQDLKPLLYPYTFVLTEGKEIQKNSLDYTLCMVQVGLPEKISSPAAEKKQIPPSDLNLIFYDRR